MTHEFFKSEVGNTIHVLRPLPEELCRGDLQEYTTLIISDEDVQFAQLSGKFLRTQKVMHKSFFHRVLYWMNFLYTWVYTRIDEVFLKWEEYMKSPTAIGQMDDREYKMFSKDVYDSLGDEVKGELKQRLEAKDKENPYL